MPSAGEAAVMQSLVPCAWTSQLLLLVFRANAMFIGAEQQQQNQWQTDSNSFY